MHTIGMPTRYKGRQYRSRLEARWACFFDLLCWRYEYEPCDFAGWIPDFVLCEAMTVFVEVKPVTLFPSEVAAKIDASGCEDEALIVGVSLFTGDVFCDNRLCLGWLRQSMDDYPSPGDCVYDWNWAVFGQYSTSSRLGFCHCMQSFADRISGCYDGGSYGRRYCDFRHLLALWVEAGNVTQWRKKPA